MVKHCFFILLSILTHVLFIIFILGSRFGYDLMTTEDVLNSFENFTSVLYGPCYRFNSGINMRNETVPLKNSIIGGRDDSLDFKFKDRVRLIVWIHNKTTPPLIQDWNNHDSPIMVEKGMRTLIGIEKTQSSKLEMPYNKCLKDLTDFNGNRKIIDYFVREKIGYRQTRCFNLCFELKYIEENPCNCTNAKLGNIWLDCWIIKENKTVNSCSFKYKNNFYKKTIADFCSSYCPSECEYSTYSYMINNIDNGDNTTSIVVYYSSLKYVSITQQPRMQLWDVISYVGGIFSLFIGLNFVALFEMFEILIENFILYIDARFFKKK